MHRVREPAVPAHVPVLDGFRGLAALLVTVFHCWSYTDPPLDQGPLRALLVSGGLGVDFFFVISGFVLLLPVARRDGDFGPLGSYARRRFARIVPAYYVALLLQALATPALSGLPSPLASPGGLMVLGLHLLFLQHEVPRWLVRQAGFTSGVVGFGVNDPLWSLSIEAAFYVLLPLVAGLYLRRPVAGCAVAVVVSLAWRWVAFSLPSLATVVGAADARVGNAPRLLEQLPGFLAHFAFGMSAALLFVHTWRSRAGSRLDLLRRRSGVIQCACLLMLVVAMVVHGNQPRGVPEGFYARYLADMVPAFAFATLMLSTALASPRAQWLMANPLARWLGDVSYGAFLWHFPLILLFVRTLGWVHGRGDAQFLALALLVLPSAFLFGWLSRRLLEEPAIRWAKR